MSQDNIKQIRIQSRVDTISGWKEANPVLLNREIGYERETGKYKIGNGNDNWNNLPYYSVGNEGATIEQLNTKVDKVSGKDLSTNDFTNEYKNQVDNMENTINTKIADLVDSAPETLDTLNELSKALGDNPNFSTTILNELASKENKAFYVETQLIANNWSDNLYSFEETYPHSDYDIEIHINGENITQEQKDAYNDAEIVGFFTSNKIKALGTIPTINIPIILKAVKK